MPKPDPNPMTAEAFAAAVDVSRETLRRFEAYAEALVKFQKTINLVSPDTLRDLWRRHFLDSAQLYRYLPPPGGAGVPRVLLDFGSGGGFPGLVLAIMADAGNQPLTVHLVESDARKCAFLREAARLAGVRVEVHNARVEDLEAFPVDVISARAVAPIDKILAVIQGFIGQGHDNLSLLLLKGRQSGEELTAAGKNWTMEVESFPSLTEAGASILRLTDIRRD